MTGQPLVFDATPEELLLFMSEGEEQLALLSQDLLRLEQEGDGNTELLQAIFRAAHTLKGSSGAIGHQRMAHLTHAAESVLDRVRRHELPVTTMLIDLLLRSLDALRVLLDEVTAGFASDLSIDALSAALVALAAGSDPIPADELLWDPGVWRVTAAIDAHCMLPAARALQIVLASAEIGSVIQTEPPQAAIEAGNVASGARVTVWLAIVGDAGEATLRQRLGRIPEIEVSAIMTAAAAPVVVSPPHTAAPPSLPSPSATPLSPSSAHAVESQRANTLQVPRMVRIDVERLDALMNLIGELVISRTRLARIGASLVSKTADQVLIEAMTETSRQIARISDDLQDQVMRSRMLPIESVFSKFPRFVRDLALKLDKRVEFVVEGNATELDRSVAEQISDPILHLLRNAIDHGLEPTADRLAAGKDASGQIRLAARHEENQIVIDVEDDGRGIISERIKQKALAKHLLTPDAASRLSDREAVELIFAPGFSTAEVISDISGRGVGMDIVRTNIERLNGSITVETEPGQGSRFTIRLPLTLAIIRALLVEVVGQIYAIPLSSVVEAVRIRDEDVRYVNQHEMIELRGMVLPLVRLAVLFSGHPAPSQRERWHATENGRQFVVAIRWGDRRGGLIVDALIGEQEIVIKPLGQIFRNAHGISGGAVLGDGQVAPIMDIAALIKHLVNDERRPITANGALA